MRVRGVLRVLLAGTASVFAAGAARADSFLTPSGPIASAQMQHLWFVTLITMIVVVPVIIGVPLLAWRYRYGNTRARYTPDWDFSTLLEWPMWVIPAIIVVVLSVYLWIDTHRLDPYRPIPAAAAPLNVEVVGLDWKWLFIYPEYHIATVGQMAFPKDRPVSMRLTTDTVMQSFIIPALGGQIYAMPGMVTKLNLKADHAGSFEGMNTQYNGEGFHGQHFKASAMSDGDFKSWVKAVQQNGVALKPAGYQVLAKSSTPAQVHATFGDAAMPKTATFFNDVAPDLFTRIVKRYHKGTAVPQAMQPGTAAYDAQVASSQGSPK